MRPAAAGSAAAYPVSGLLNGLTMCPGGRCEPVAVLRGPQLHGLRADTIPGATGLAANPVQVAAWCPAAVSGPAVCRG